MRPSSYALELVYSSLCTPELVSARDYALEIVRNLASARIGLRKAGVVMVVPYLEASYLEVAPYLEARRRRTSRWTLRADRATRPPGVGGPGGSVASSAVHGGNGIDLPLEGPQPRPHG